SLGDMCGFTVSPATNRWYWHHAGSSQFRAGDQSIGYCDATWDRATTPGSYLDTAFTGEGIWREACSEPGHVTVLQNADDDVVRASLPFGFRYWGRALPEGSTVTISTNGWM